MTNKYGARPECAGLASARLRSLAHPRILALFLRKNDTGTETGA